MKIGKVLLFIGICVSTLFAKGHFSSQADICDRKVDKLCSDDYNLVRELQITLNKDKRINVHIKTDGKYGKNTEAAIKKFQKVTNLEKIDGWVGRATKVELDKIAKHIKFPKRKKVASSRVYRTYKEFKKHTNLRRSFRVFKDNALLAKARANNVKLEVDISQQRLTMFVNGKVALSSPCTTGAKRKFEPNTKIYRDKRTPRGTFRIKEKIRDKRSTVFGDYYRGRKRVYHGDRRKFRGSRAGLRYRGASLMYWMRLTSDGIGLHASKYVKRYPGTNGCVRLPYRVAKSVFSHVRKGTTVRVVR